MSTVSFAEIINKRKLGLEHTPEELQYLVSGSVSGQLADYQISAWLMATYFNNLSKKNTAELTAFMRDSGETIAYPENLLVVDKHSTGGVGDKCTLITAPIVAACGGHIGSLAGRGLGHTGGTLDKLESIPGFKVFISKEEIVKNVASSGLCIAGQTKNICPADKKLYALRDVTSTVDSISLICASIMSKKLAEGIKALVLDVKFGSGAFMKTIEEARELAQWLKEIGELNGLKVQALITDMSQPLGRYAGNALEIKECVEILQGRAFVENDIDFYSDTRELSLQLAAHLIYLSQIAPSVEEAYKLAHEKLQNGEAYSKYLDMCHNQGATKNTKLPEAEFKQTIKAPQSGYITEINTEALGYACVDLKAGRAQSGDLIDPANGIEWHFKKNQPVKAGDTLFTLYSNDSQLLLPAEDKLLKALTFSDSPGTNYKLIEGFLT